MSMFRKALGSVKPYQPGKPIEEVKRALGVEEVYKLASNESPFAPRYIRAAILREIKYIHRYPEASCFYVRAELARRLKVSPDQLVFGNGSDEILTMVLRACVAEGDEVVVAYPTFLIYEIQARVQGARVVQVPLKNCRYDLAAMAEAVTADTKVVFIANPDNPTGTYVNHACVRDFLRKIPQDVFVVFDEAYFEFASGVLPRTLEFVKQRGNCIVTRTFSKVYGLAGMRLGYGITTPEIAGVLNSIREPFNINRFAQVAALAALKDTGYVKKVLTHIAAEKKYVYKELSALGQEYIESVTNFILINFCRDTTELNAYLLQNGIIVRELKGWGLPNYFRVTLGLRKENKKFIRCLKKFLKG